MKTIAFHNLGCKVNSYELDVMQQNTQKNGWKVVNFDQKSDVYVINTCSVTNIADRKSRQMIHRAKSLNPDAVVVAAGCYVQADAFALSQDESVDLLVGNNCKARLSEILDEYITAKRNGTLPRYAAKILEEQEGAAEAEPDGKTVGALDKDKLPSGGNISGTRTEIENYLTKTLGNTTIVDLKKVPFEDANITHTDSHTRGYIKIQDGCNRYCSYCIIPYTRGVVRSKPVDDVLKEAETMVSCGVREIVLTGIHVSSYGVDFRVGTPAEHILNLLTGLDRIPNLKRIRLSSFEPRLITEEFAEGLKQIEKLCPHFHLSLQSGCDETLERMNRKYTSAEYAGKVAILRKAFPDAAITTDVIVGFPRETEKEFATTRQFCEQIGFYEMHVFKYSRRRGTPADADPEQVPEQVKSVRSDILLELTAKQSLAFRKKWLNRPVEVLFEETKEIDGRIYWLGHTKEYVLIAVHSDENLENRLLTVTPESLLRNDVLLASGVESSL
ncbi:MAG: tRNA (N(6)-L-threonylcarbamoyladenosine(37)-C(2))-methylthiotransferase MtaB [Lachnospiraceae bacterium]|nr:tRNA (N(6)-L-threonylcarbamoyladenosine(37)-C(2))-methylthiotransferase MtaB [Lachnospiraceae bacterium]